MGPDHPDVATYLEKHAEVLRKLNRAEEANDPQARAKAIRTKPDGKQPAR